MHAELSGKKILEQNLPGWDEKLTNIFEVNYSWRNASLISRPSTCTQKLECLNPVSCSKVLQQENQPCPKIMCLAPADCSKTTSHAKKKSVKQIIHAKPWA
jgi:hypothetical protein